MTTYTAILNPFYALRPEFEGRGLPKAVSFFGAAPRPLEAYEVKHKPSIEVNDRGRVTYSDYFFGKVIQTPEEAEAVAERLNARQAEIYARHAEETAAL